MASPIHGAGQDQIPQPDADLSIWADNFAATWDPPDFNVVLPLAATISAAAVQFAGDLAIATDPPTRTPVTIQTKDASRLALVALLRGAAGSAQAAFLAGTATEAQVNTLGLRANSLIRTSIGAPTFAPLIAVSGMSSGVVQMRLTQVDPVTGAPISSRRYPYGIVAVELERKIAAGSFLTNQTTKRVNLVDDTTGIAMGTLLTYRGRYITARGLIGPWSAEIIAVAA